MYFVFWWPSYGQLVSPVPEILQLLTVTVNKKSINRDLENYESIMLHYDTYNTHSLFCLSTLIAFCFTAFCNTELIKALIPDVLYRPKACISAWACINTLDGSLYSMVLMYLGWAIPHLFHLVLVLDELRVDPRYLLLHHLGSRIDLKRRPSWVKRQCRGFHDASQHRYRRQDTQQFKKRLTFPIQSERLGGAWFLLLPKSRFISV